MSRYPTIRWGCSAVSLFAPLSYAAPVAIQDVRQVTQGATVIIDVLSNDQGSGALEIVSFSQPQGGVVTVSPGGGLRLVLADDYFGELSFSYEIQDASGELSQTTVSVIVVRSALDAEVISGSISTDALAATQAQLLQTHSSAVSQWLKISSSGDQEASAGDGLIPLGGVFASIHSVSLDSMLQHGAVTQNTDIQGLTVGADWNWGERWVVGAAAGINSAESNLANAKQTLDETSLLIFGQFHYGQWLAEGQMGLSQSDVEQSGISGFATDGKSQFALVKAEYRYGGKAWQVMPGLSLTNTKNHLNGFDQQIASRQFVYEEYESRHLRAVISLYVDYAISTTWGVILPQLTLASDYCVDASTDGQNVVVNNESFAIQGADDNQHLTIDAGIAFWLTHGLSGFVNYHRLGRNDALNLQGINLGVRWEF